MRYSNRHNAAQIGQSVGMNAPAVRAAMRRARVALYKCIQSNYGPVGELSVVINCAISIKEANIGCFNPKRLAADRIVGRVRHKRSCYTKTTSRELLSFTRHTRRELQC